jgi:hypothetical protein
MPFSIFHDEGSMLRVCHAGVMCLEFIDSLGVKRREESKAAMCAFRSVCEIIKNIQDLPAGPSAANECAMLSFLDAWKSGSVNSELKRTMMLVAKYKS